MSNFSILIVENEGIVAEDLAGKIRQLGYDVADTTASGEEAVELARGVRPSLVLVDMRLAGAMDGIAAATEIQRECQLPVLFLTAHSDSGTLDRARQAEAFGYILKPFDERDLRIQIEMALYKHAAKRRLCESEERLRSRGDNLPDSAVYQYVHELNGNVRFTYLSEGMDSLNGVSVAEALRDAGALHRQIQPEYFARFAEAEALSARTLSDFNLEVPMLRPDGELHWMQLHSRPRRLPDGGVVWDGIQTDITERKRFEEVLQERQQALEQSRAELQAANGKLLDSRRAALNMMADAVAARRQAEEASAELRREAAERKQAEEAMRLSEERYRSLFNTLIEGFCIIEVLFDAQDCPIDYRFLELNPSFEELTGLHNAQGKLMRELAPEHEAHWFEMYGKVALTGETARFINEAKALHRWYDVSAYRVGGTQSRRVAILFNDISEAKRAEEALRESKHRYSSLFSNKISGMAHCRIITDETGRPIDYLILQVNDAYQRITGVEKADIEGRRCRDVFPGIEDFAFDYIGTYGKIALQGGEILFEEFIEATGQCLSIYAYSPLPGEFAAIFTDVTERKRAEKELQRAKEQPEAATRVKSQFLANMSHELRTPMTGVLGMLDLVLAGNLDALQQDYIETAQTSARSMVRILNDILDLTKIEAGKLSIEEKPFSVWKCVQQTYNILLPVAKGKGIDLEVTVADDVPEMLVGDQTRLNQILTNLAGNAVKFTGKGKVEIRVAALGYTPSGKREFTITVADTGIGIPDDKKGLLFGFFSQVDESHSRVYGGTGLGLAISKEVVERMGGTISFTSEAGKGSTFSCIIPLGVAHFESGTISSSTAATGDFHHGKEKRKPHILIAEDDPTIRKILGVMLQKSNYEVDFADDGQTVVIVDPGFRTKV